MPGPKSCFSHKQLNSTGVGMSILLQVVLVWEQQAVFREASSLVRVLLFHWFQIQGRLEQSS